MIETINEFYAGLGISGLVSLVFVLFLLVNKKYVSLARSFTTCTADSINEFISMGAANITRLVSLGSTKILYLIDLADTDPDMPALIELSREGANVKDIVKLVKEDVDVPALLEIIDDQKYIAKNAKFGNMPTPEVQARINAALQKAVDVTK